MLLITPANLFFSEALLLIMLMTICGHLSHAIKFTFSGSFFLHENEYTGIVIYKNHSDAVEKSRYDSPERQTFVTEGWFTAGDFLQQQKTSQCFWRGTHACIVYQCYSEIK